MLNRIYALPLPLTAFGMLFLAAAWAWLASRYAARPAAVQRGWRIGNGILAALSLGAVLYATLLDRGGETVGLTLRPFQLLRDAAAEPELYRSLLMNVLLFEPLGLTLTQALPPRGTAGQRAVLTVLAATLLSAVIEAAQYAFGLGRAETDDVLCNTLGALLGALALPLGGALGTKNGENSRI